MDTSPENVQACPLKEEAVAAPLTIYYPDTGKRYSAFSKRAFDVVIASLLTVGLLSWLYPLLWVLIKLSSRGPAIFTQQRIGYRDKEFRCLKFRTMYVNTHSDTREASRHDMRITPIGHILRKTCIDELPQLWNVLRGDMSIVGPRPHMLLHHRRFSSSLPRYNERHHVKPGITGLAQVRGYHGAILDYHCIHGRTRLDLFYIRKASLALDMKILLYTLPIIFRIKHH